MVLEGTPFPLLAGATAKAGNGPVFGAAGVGDCLVFADKVKLGRPIWMALAQVGHDCFDVTTSELSRFPIRIDDVLRHEAFVHGKGDIFIWPKLVPLCFWHLFRFGPLFSSPVIL